MNAVGVLAQHDAASRRVQPASRTESSVRGRAGPSDTGPSYEDVLQTIVIQLGLCGALVNRDSIEFARGIAELLVWSAEHARASADHLAGEADEQCSDWLCACCRESVPVHFDLCWNCETQRGTPAAQKRTTDFTDTRQHVGP